MCIIIFKPIGQKLSEQNLRRAQKSNSQGTGYVAAINGHLKLIKESGGFDKIWHNYKKSIVNKGLEEQVPVIFHFRIKTHGPTNRNNAHPFIIDNGDGWAFAHNGVIDGVRDAKIEDYSDTLLFKKLILDRLPKGSFENKSIMALIRKYIGMGSKLVFLNKNGKHIIVNETRGIWDGGVWYSNESYKPPKPIVTNIYTHNSKRYSYSYPSFDEDYYPTHLIGYFDQTKTIAEFMEEDKFTYVNKYKPQVTKPTRMACKKCFAILGEDGDDTDNGICKDCLEMGTGIPESIPFNLNEGMNLYD